MPQAFYVETPHSERHSAMRTAHPEAPERLTVIHSALENSGLLSKVLTQLEDNQLTPPQRAEVMAELHMVHSARYLGKLARACLHTSKNYEHYLDNDTYITRDTLNVVIDSANLVKIATQQAIKDRTSAFCAVRPPGHHAGRQFYGGFCVANFSALAAQTARRLGVEKVAIIDWDAHYGNGTQSIFNKDPNVFYLSLHGQGQFPRGGTAADQGSAAGKGFSRNIVLPEGVKEAEYIQLFATGLRHIQASIAPGVIIISSGFDGHENDPLSNLALTSNAYGELTQMVRTAWPRTPIISVLEGGYNLTALAESVTSHIKNLTD
jgi:acetoin utilization deacetylase AcuC-like enzyme